MPAKLNFPFDRPWSLEQAVPLACLLEASAPKVGNVHPSAHFDDMGFTHFLASSLAIREVFAQTGTLEVGELALQAVLATRTSVGCNTNLGTLLLFAPLAKAHLHHASGDLRSRLAAVLNELGPRDAHAIYAAIRAAKPGGLGKPAQGDVADDAPADIIPAMQLVADVDAVARQYTQGFADIFERLLPWLQNALLRTEDPLDAICQVQLRWLAYEPDGLIVRKAGRPIAEEVQQRATTALTRPEQRTDLDQFLRADGNRRNPGTTADLLAATLLVALLSC